MTDRKPQHGGVWGGVLPPQLTPPSDDADDAVESPDLDDGPPATTDDDVPPTS